MISGGGQGPSYLASITQSFIQKAQSFIRIYIYIYVCVYIRTYIYIYIYNIYIYTRIYVHIHISISISMVSTYDFFNYVATCESCMSILAMYELNFAVQQFEHNKLLATFYVATIVTSKKVAK